MKKCCKCKKEKDESEFHKANNTKDKLYSHCKACKKEYCDKNKLRKKDYDKLYREDNKDHIKETVKQYKIKNKEKIKENNKRYRIKNKEKINKYSSKRAKIDICFRLHRNISRVVNFAVRGRNCMKRGKSVSQYLSYTFQQLKLYLESLFEPWMNWDNWGKYDPNRRTWQIDHIIPQSLLPYDSMDHPNFQKCWALENLRPLDALENIKKGNKYVQR